MRHLDGLAMSWYTDSFPLGVVRHSAPPSGEWHTHAYTELAIILAGQGIHETPLVEYPIAAGDIFRVAREQPHRNRDDEQLAIAHIIYDAEKLPLPYRYLGKDPGYQALITVEPLQRARHGLLRHLRVSKPELTQVVDILDKLEEELARQSPGYEAAALAQFIALLVYLARAYQQQVSVSAPNILRIGKVLALLETNCTRQFTITELAEVAKLSRGHFMRIFTETMGLPPMAYVAQLRMNKARDLLSSTLLPITAVATRVGYHDGNFFTRQFKKTCHCTPYQYRHGIEGVL